MFCFITGTFWAGGEKKSKHAQKTWIWYVHVPLKGSFQNFLQATPSYRSSPLPPRPYAMSPMPPYSLTGVQKELMVRCLPQCMFLTSRKPYFVSFSSKSNEVNDWKQKLQNQSETFKLETKKKEEDIFSKEKRIQELLENCKNLEKRVAEYSQARSEVEERSASSLEEIIVSWGKNSSWLCIIM